MSISKSSKNALTHGAYSKLTLLSWENEQEFIDLHEALRKEFFPDGACEEEAVLDLASLHWKKRRLAVGSQLMFLRTPDAKALEAAGAKKGWEGIADYLASSVQNAEKTRALYRDMATALAEAASNIGTRLAERAKSLGSDDAPATSTSGTPGCDTAKSGIAKNATNQKSKSSSNEMESLIMLAQTLQSCLREIISMRHAAENVDWDERLCERAYGSELMERESKVHADFDKRIEKKITLLVRLKEYKRYYGTQQAKVPLEQKNLPAKPQTSELDGPQPSPSTIDAESTTLAPK
jgi:hypothetical protein